MLIPWLLLGALIRLQWGQLEVPFQVDSIDLSLPFGRTTKMIVTLTKLQAKFRWGLDDLGVSGPSILSI